MEGVKLFLANAGERAKDTFGNIKEIGGGYLATLK